MKPPKRKRLDRTLPRVSRDESYDLPHDENLWAISYADLLLVLMAFFVIFASFNTEDEASKTLMSIARNIGTVSTPANAGGIANSGEANGQGNGSGQIVGLDQKFFKELETLASVSEMENEKKIVLTFQDQIFGVGSFAISPSLGADIKKIYEHLRDHQDTLKITLVGHADSRSFTQKRDIIQDNFDLSAMRALQALKEMRRLGFPEAQLVAKASSHFKRESRSLSMEIEWRTP